MNVAVVKSICLAPGMLAGLRASIAAEAKAQRAPLRRRLEALECAAKLVENEITDPTLLSLLLKSDDDRIEQESATAQGLADIAQRARAAVPQLRGRGRAKSYPRKNGLAATTQCALIVSVACDLWPGKDNETAQAACAEVWKAAGGPGRGSLATWRDHLRDAREYKNTIHATVIRKALRKGPGEKSA